MTSDSAQEIRHAEEPDVCPRVDPARLAGLVLLHRLRRLAGAGRARACRSRSLCKSCSCTRQDYLYKWLPPIANHLLVAVYLGVCVYAFVYFHYRVRAHRDLLAGLVHAERLHRRAADVPAGDGAVPARASRCCSGPTCVLVVYTLWGYLSPIDFFWHPGTSFHRVVTSSTVEFSTGIYGIYGQLALTLIAAFLLLAGVANGFDAQRAMINVVRLHRRPVAAADPADRGGRIERHRHDQRQRLGQRRRGRHHHHSADDPLRRSRHLRGRGRDGGLDGRPDHAADDGRRRVPDVGIPRRALLGRGGARLLRLPSSTTSRSASRSICCACACCRSDPIERPQVPLYDKVKTAIFFSSVLYLLYLMGYVGKGELLAALYTATFMFVLLVAALPLLQVRAARTRRSADETLFGNMQRAIETHAEMTSYLTLLLATLGIMIGLFTVTGFINRMGGDADRPRRLEHHRHDPHGVGVRLARRRRPAADRDLHHRRGRHRAADEEARHRSLGRALLRVPAVGLGRAVAADLAHRRGLRADRQRVVPAGPCTRR